MTCATRISQQDDTAARNLQTLEYWHRKARAVSVPNRKERTIQNLISRAVKRQAALRLISPFTSVRHVTRHFGAATVRCSTESHRRACACAKEIPEQIVGLVEFQLWTELWTVLLSVRLPLQSDAVEAHHSLL